MNACRKLQTAETLMTFMQFIMVSRIISPNDNSNKYTRSETLLTKLDTLTLILTHTYPKNEIYL